MKTKSKKPSKPGPGLAIEIDLERKTIRLDLLGNRSILMDKEDALYLAKRLRLAVRRLYGFRRSSS
jgi:hypothetical protein